MLGMLEWDIISPPKSRIAYVRSIRYQRKMSYRSEGWSLVRPHIYS